MTKKIYIFLIIQLFVFRSMASSAAADDRFDMGWYSSVYYEDRAADIVSIGSSLALFYHQGYLTDTKVQSRLDGAYANGLKVIMDVDGITEVDREITYVDVPRLQEYINLFKNHPAVVGWYIADEPSGSSSIANCQIAYDAIKAVDTDNSVYICINKTDNTIIDYASTYDVLIADQYDFEQGDSEFYRLEDHGIWPFWIEDGLKTSINDISSRAAAANRPWVLAGQGFGRASTYEARLPTYNEHRFQTYYAFHKGAVDFLTWEYTTALASAAGPSDPYPYSGEQWLTEVYQPLAEEIAIVGNALGTAADTTHISDNVSSVHSKLYEDPNNGKYYLFALNDADSSHTVNFNLSLPGDWAAALPLDGNGSIPISSGQFSDSFNQYEVILYELLPENTAPVAVNDFYSVSEDNTLSILPAGVLENDWDPDSGDTLTSAKTGDPSHGSVTLNPDGSLTYTPHDNWHGTDTFTYKANDGSSDSNEAMVSITVDPVPDLALVDNGCPATGLHSYTLTATNPGIVTLSKFTIDGKLHQVFASEEEHSEWLGDNSASTSETTDSYVIFGDIRLPDLGGGTWSDPGDPPDKFTEETVDGGGTVGFGTLNNYDKENDFWDAYIKLGVPSFDEETVDLMQLVTPDGGGFTVVLTLVVATGYDQAGNLTTQRYELTLALPTLMPGDADGNGCVDAEDVAILAQNWLQDSDVTWAMGDFNRDGKVNDIDATILAANWNPQSASVPEPTLVISMFSGLAIFQLTRWKRPSRPLRPVPHDA